MGKATGGEELENDDDRWKAAKGVPIEKVWTPTGFSRESDGTDSIRMPLERVPNHHDHP
jgi:hypothetical protein